MNDIWSGMRRVFRCSGNMLRLLGILLLWNGQAGGAEVGGATLPAPVLEAQHISGRADVLASQGKEQEAADLYLEAHLKFQSVMEKLFEMGFRASVGERSAPKEPLLQTDRVVAELRDLNLTKLWVVLDPDDRAFWRVLEDERADLVHRYPEFTSMSVAEPLEELFLRLYPDDVSGSRQIEVLREGRLPSSARWARLESRRGAN